MQTVKPRTADEAIGRWPGILQALGIDPAFLTKKHGPCPMCGGKDRFRFDDKEGRGTWFCSGCGSGDGFKLLQELKGYAFKEAAQEIDRIIGTVPVGPVTTQRTDSSKIEALTAVWASSKPVTRGDPVWNYLNQRLGLESVPADLRYHPALRYTDTDGKDWGRFPAMLGRIRYLKTFSGTSPISPTCTAGTLRTSRTLKRKSAPTRSRCAATGKHWRQRIGRAISRPRRTDMNASASG